MQARILLFHDGLEFHHKHKTRKHKTQNVIIAQYRSTEADADSGRYTIPLPPARLVAMTCQSFCTETIRSSENGSWPLAKEDLLGLDLDSLPLTGSICLT